jgi:hypothetical protein
MALTTGRSSGHEGWQERAGWLLAAALLGVIIFGYLMPVTSYFTAVPGDLGDPRYNAFVLEHLYRFATGYAAGLWNPDSYYPFQGTLAFSDNHFGSGATYVLARLLGLSREHAFDVWFSVGTLLNFASALYVLRRLGLSTAAAALGAFFFAFALPVPAQDAHAQLVHRFAAPLAVLALWQMFERRRLVDLARLAFFAVWQFYCSIYLGIFLVYLLAALTVALLIVRRPLEWPQWRRNLIAERFSIKLAAGGILLASVLALAYLGGRYYLIAQAYNLEHFRSVEVITPMLPRLGSYLLADGSPLLAWLGRGVWVPMRHEHQMFIGFGATVLILTAAGIAWRGRAGDPGLTRAMLIALGLLVAGTLWIGELSLYYLVAWLPGIKAIRGVSRIILIMLVPMSVLLALGADAAWRRFGQSAWAAMPVLAGLAALVVAEPLSVSQRSAPIAEWRAHLDAVKALLPPAMPKDAILLVRTSSTDIDEQINTELDAMLLGQDLGYPVLNGYSAFVPPGYRLGPCASATQRLRGYFLFTGGTAVPDSSRRLVVLDLDACPSR